MLGDNGYTTSKGVAWDKSVVLRLIKNGYKEQFAIL
jgi:hypothetical protein